MSHEIKNVVPSTQPIQFIYGSFTGSGDWCIPYVIATLSYEEAARDIKLTSEIPGADTLDWTIEELYQRSIDYKRTANITKYLRDDQLPQFFNSITVALLPLDPQTDSVAAGFDADIDWQAPPIPVEPGQLARELQVGPIKLGYWTNWEKLGDVGSLTGVMVWNTKQVFGVAIDGQHRLASIKNAVEAMKPKQRTATRVPMIFLMFDEKLGYRAPVGTPVVRLLRRLFIDLNKHARTVSRARQILLDDQDPHAKCVRQLVENKLSPNLEGLQSVQPRLPLSAVDWHSEQAKFDTGPFLTTVLGLDWIVTEILGSPVVNPTDYPKLDRLVSSIQKAVDLDLSDAKQRLETIALLNQSPFSFTDDELDSIAESFSAVWNGAIVELLTRFSPYEGLLQLREGNESLSLDWQEWYRLSSEAAADKFSGRPTKDYEVFLGQLQNFRSPPVTEAVMKSRLRAIEDFKAENLAFTVVFQRALVEGMLEYLKMDEVAVQELMDDLTEGDIVDIVNASDDDWPVTEVVDDAEDELEEDELEEDELEEDERVAAVQAADFVDNLNSLLESVPKIFTINFPVTNSEGELVRFWQGSMRKPEGGIDFAQAASTRAKDWIFLLAYLMLIRVATVEWEDPPTFDTIWGLSRESSASPALRRFAAAANRLCREPSVAGRILQARDQVYSESAAMGEIQDRLEAVWNLTEL